MDWNRGTGATEEPDRELTRQIIGSAIEVHRVLGPGLLESIYEAALAHEMSQRGLRIERQVAVPVAGFNFNVAFLRNGMRRILNG